MRKACFKTNKHILNILKQNDSLYINIVYINVYINIVCICNYVFAKHIHKGPYVLIIRRGLTRFKTKEEITGILNRKEITKNFVFSLFKII